jgi:molecular chaperone DnaK (HSP70)
MSPRFRIGIDLGTTNCALASIAAGDPEGRSVVLEIPQPETGHSTVSALTLPSCLYLPPGGDAWIAGRWARARAAEVPGRVVRSAKSWLTHHAADRRAPFLPLGSTDLAPADLLSPVQAQARLLRVLADAWDAAHPDAPLAHQEVAVTVPASFDPVAQQLTLEAAAAAGFPAGTLLLEEPQAAFYAWRETQARRATPGQLGHPDPVSDRAGHVLVVDLGGGTTDFSLFSVEPQPEGAPPHLRRIAVSEHILLGGDNLDLALAHHVESRSAPRHGTARHRVRAAPRALPRNQRGGARPLPDRVTGRG